MYMRDVEDSYEVCAMTMDGSRLDDRVRNMVYIEQVVQSFSG